MAITSNLYPPIVLDSMPAFNRYQECKIYFALPIYNALNEIRQNAVQVSVINQKTNAIALDTSKYKAGIKVTSMGTDASITNDYKYYVTITTDDLKANVFELNTYYKVQLRLTPTSGATAPPSGSSANADAISTWIYNNVDYFSEWSSIVLIKGIQPPKISITGLDPDNETILSTSEYTISGKYYYEKVNNKNVNEKQYLKSYKITLYKKENDKNIKVFQSDQIYTSFNARNQINYQIQQLEDGESYKLNIKYTTINSYQGVVSFDFSVVLDTFNLPQVNIKATPDPENARNKIELEFVKNKKNLGNFTIRRSSSKNNFNKWEDIKTFYYNGAIDTNKYIWYDYVIESGIWYKYCIQARGENSSRSIIKEIRLPIMCQYEDMFLIGNNRQLKIQFNPVIGDFRYNVVESQQTTIGAKFPYIKRNSENYYRTFSIGGLITSLSDYSDWYNNLNRTSSQKELFTSKKEIYREFDYLYSDYNKKNNINKYNDFIYEKEFREKVYDFLYDNNVKLFKSAAQGLIMVKLMNIGFQPMENLGRKLYSFSATAVEIAQPSLKFYDYYNIQSIGKITKFKETTFETIGQFQSTNYSNKNIYNAILNKHKLKAPQGYSYNLKKLKWIRIEFKKAGEPLKETNNTFTAVTTYTQDQGFEDSKLGFVLQIKTEDNVKKQIFIPQKVNIYSNSSSTNQKNYGFYELKGEDVAITELQFLYFKKSIEYNIDYLAEFTIIENNSTSVPKQYFYYQQVGQECGGFLSNESIISRIYNKHSRYYYSGVPANKRFEQNVISVNNVIIETFENAVVYIKDSKDTEFNRHIVTNGYLQLNDPAVNIEGIYFYGIHLNENELKYISGDYSNFNQIKNPVSNGVYHINTYGFIPKSFKDSTVVFGSSGYSYKKGVATVGTEDVESKYSEEWSTYENTKLNKINQMYTLLIKNLENEFDNKYVYYQEEWYPLFKNNDIPLVSIDGIVNYICEIKRGKL